VPLYESDRSEIQEQERSPHCISFFQHENNSDGGNSSSSPGRIGYYYVYRIQPPGRSYMGTFIPSPSVYCGLVWNNRWKLQQQVYVYCNVVYSWFLTQRCLCTPSAVLLPRAKCNGPTTACRRADILGRHICLEF
jgi:hypothetical protein